MPGGWVFRILLIRLVCNMNSTSSANSSVSTTAIARGGGGGFQIPSDLISIHNRKDEALQALKRDIMEALNKEVKSLDEHSWMFDGPRSRVHLISGPATFMNKKIKMLKLAGNGLYK